jgi:hypothetical protein
MLFFLHIPKTAGTSVYNALHQMAPGRVAWYSGPTDTLTRFLSTPGIRGSVTIYGGHFGYKQIRGFLAPGDKIFSVIREPVERVLSTYNHVAVRDPTHPLHEQLKNLSIIEAAKASSLFRMEISNRQCFYLSGTTIFEDTRQVVIDGNIQVYTTSQLGLLISHMAAACGVSDPPEIGSHNVAEDDYKARATAEEIELINQLNWEDCKLYAHFSKIEII